MDNMNKELDEILIKAIESANDYNTEYDFEEAGHAKWAVDKAKSELLAWRDREQSKLLDKVIADCGQFDTTQGLSNYLRSYKRIKLNGGSKDE